MENLLVSESTLTDRYQTTVPEPVRKALNLGKREKIKYEIQPDGSVLLSKAQADSQDPVINGFLNVLAKDMERNPEKLKALSPELISQLDDLVGNMDVDLDEPLPEE